MGNATFFWFSCFLWWANPKNLIDKQMQWILAWQVWYTSWFVWLARCSLRHLHIHRNRWQWTRLSPVFMFKRIAVRISWCDFEATFVTRVLINSSRIIKLTWIGEVYPMNKLFSQIVVSVSKINKNHLQVLLALLVLSMLVLGAGAPEGYGGTGG